MIEKPLRHLDHLGTLRRKQKAGAWQFGDQSEKSVAQRSRAREGKMIEKPLRHLDHLGTPRRKQKAGRAQNNK